MKHHLLKTKPPLPIGDVRSLGLTEGLNQHSTLIAPMLINGRSSKLYKAPGSSISWTLPREHGGAKVFDGIITEISSQNEVATIIAKGKSVLRDQVRRTSSYGDGLTSKPIHDIPDLASILENLKGKGNLRRKISHVYRPNLTDWEFQVYLASLCGMAMVATVQGDEIFDGKVHRPRLIPDNAILDGTLTTMVRLGGYPVESLTWKPPSGEIPGQAGVGRPALLPFLNAPVSDCSHQIFCDGFSENWDDQARAEHLANTQITDLVRWRMCLRTPQPTCGDFIRLGPKWAIPHPLLVLSRHLSFSPDSGDRVQLVNEITCVPAGFGFGSPPAGVIGPRPLVPVTGQVINLNDSQRQGRIKVNFPWHKRSGRKPDTWGGVWCLPLMPFAGTDEEDREHGTWNPPDVYDWARVLIDPLDCGSPLILGAVYRGNAKLPARVKDPRSSRLLLQTADGIAIYAEKAGQGRKSALTLVLEDSAGKVLAKIVLSGQGKLTLSASDVLELMAKTVKITAEDELSINAKTKILGNLKVKGKQ